LEVVKTSPLNNKELCAVAFDCENQADFPILRWNITLPGRKPPPHPPQPPAVSVGSHITIQEVEHEGMMDEFAHRTKIDFPLTFTVDKSDYELGI